ncbi:AAA family ATPase [Burkholderia sp. KJ006]|uniref:AAA family ATPase n=1 Tax=Burkholderia sp. KJ006 TaxID=416344 RepID=UPI00059FF381|nr:AAA family ATPase [Burkholderia sp. KJ006]
MEITIENCNSIDSAKISLVVGRLNIKYGPNGTGKSTIAKAIELSALNDAGLMQLTPFKHRGKEADAAVVPKVSGADQFKTVFVFNEEYVDQFVFMQDEVVKNSFDIFIKNSDYKKKMDAIDALISEIKMTFAKNANIEQVLKDLTELSEDFGKSQAGFSKAGRISKAIGSGNKLEHIPDNLAPYTSFIKSEANVKWIGWQIKGNEFLELASECPYCASPTGEKKETILAVSKEYEAKSIEHLIALLAVVGRLGKYFSKETFENINKILSNKTELKKEEISYLTNLKLQIDTLREKLQDLKTISFFSLRDVDEIQKRIASLKIDINLMSALDSEESRAIVHLVNESLESVLTKAGQLQGEINKQKKSIETTINKHKSDINSFLRYAGYKYVVDIQAEAESYKMKLKHLEFSEHITNGSRHLSYGERNAFSIVLFMYECLMKHPDLIVLDDPISSFDKNKKFAILEMLFRGKDSLRDKTVLMLTHDIEPVIDMVKSLSHTFQPTPVASFLSSKTGIVTELDVKKSDLLTFAQICDENIKSLDNDVIKSIYLRRHYEIVDNKGLEYQLISSLLHKEATPTVKENEGKRAMTEAEIAGATAAIQIKLPSFEYQKLLSWVLDAEVMKKAYTSAKNGYEKLQLFRIVNNDNHDNDIVKKYINESFHIENEYIMQLNPHRYDSVPDYIIAECDLAMGVQ